MDKKTLENANRVLSNIEDLEREIESINYALDIYATTKYVGLGIEICYDTDNKRVSRLYPENSEFAIEILKKILEYKNELLHEKKRKFEQM